MDFCGPDSHLGKVPYQIWNPHRISKSKGEKIFKSFENWTFVVQPVIWRKYNIGFWIPIKFQSQRKKIIQISPETTKLEFCGPESHLGKVKYRILNPHQISKSKNFFFSNRSRNNEIGLMWSWQSFGESTISDFESPSNFQVKEKKLFKLVQKQRNYALTKNAKIIIFK